MLNERRMKMKKSFLSIAFMAVFMLMATNSQAQSWSDLLNKDNISKVVNAITGTTESIDMTGTWNYKGSAVEFESDNLLMKAGGAAAGYGKSTAPQNGRRSVACQNRAAPVGGKTGGDHYRRHRL